MSIPPRYWPIAIPICADGLLEAEHATCDLTAITEDELDLQDEGVAFALATLQDNQITHARVSDLPQIAERARLALKF